MTLLPRNPVGAETRARMSDPVKPDHRPARWAIVLAFALVYLSWGTTFFAIRAGVHSYHLPPALFSGCRVGLAGVLLLTYLTLRGERLTMPGRDFAWVVAAGLLMFVGGNGLMTVALTAMPSGMAAVLGATTPLGMAVLEWFWPHGERLGLVGWVGLFVGLGGVFLLMAPELQQAHDVHELRGPLLILGSSACWSLGSVILHHQRPNASHLAAAGYQMVLGGGGLALLGLALGEAAELTPDMFSAGALGTFVYLLVFGSLIGYTAFNWLLGNAPTPLVGTYAYVNPVVAVCIGTVLGHEPLTGWLVAGLVVILAAVALVRSGRKEPAALRLATEEQPRFSARFHEQPASDLGP
jgi:drug/metabolite transporter (DMT)-like permease